MELLFLNNDFLSQNNGKFTPSVAADLIERLPEVGDAQRPMEERIAKNVVWVAYAGTWRT